MSEPADSVDHTGPRACIYSDSVEVLQQLAPFLRQFEEMLQQGGGEAAIRLFGMHTAMKSCCERLTARIERQLTQPRDCAQRWRGWPVVGYAAGEMAALVDEATVAARLVLCQRDSSAAGNLVVGAVSLVRRFHCELVHGYARRRPCPEDFVARHVSEFQHSLRGAEWQLVTASLQKRQHGKTVVNRLLLLNRLEQMFFHLVNINAVLKSQFSACISRDEGYGTVVSPQFAGVKGIVS